MECGGRKLQSAVQIQVFCSQPGQYLHSGFAFVRSIPMAEQRSDVGFQESSTLRSRDFFGDDRMRSVALSCNRPLRMGHGGHSTP